MRRAPCTIGAPHVRGKGRMNKSHLLKSVFALGLSAACAWSLAGCATDNGEASNRTGGVAATIDGVEIPEDEVTNYIEDRLRVQQNLSEEDAWGAWLAENDYTPESLREAVIDMYVQRELITKGAEERGVTVDGSEVDSSLETMKGYYDSDEKWQSALEQAGWTEDAYRTEIELSLKMNKLQETFASDEDPKEEDLLSYAQMYASAYDGAKRSSHILFDAGDEATAQEVLDKINAGELDFAEAAKQYSKDTGSAEKGGDVGWDATASFVQEYTDGLDPLEKDQVSGLVTSEHGIHIIKCTDVFNAPKTTGEDGTENVEITSIDQIPVEWQDSVKDTLKAQQASSAYQTWLTEAKEAADIVINDMPEGLPYYVDMSKYQTDDGADDGTAEGGADGSTDAGSGDGTDAGDTGDGADAGSTDGVDAGADGTDGSGEPAADGSQPNDAGEGSPDQSSGQPAEAA